jgi:hypothetical protein
MLTLIRIIPYWWTLPEIVEQLRYVSVSLFHRSDYDERILHEYAQKCESH